jgi:hypothetical protein
LIFNIPSCDQLITFSNPSHTRTINNINLELAASFTQHDVLAQQSDIREVAIHNSSDNVATVW